MVTALVALHYIICFLLTLTVLLQFGKGAEAGAMMGSGSSQNIFTSSSKSNMFSKLTTVLAVLFMANSLALTVLKSGESKKSIFDSEPVAMPLNTDTPAQDSAANGAEKEENKAEAAPKADIPKTEETK
jgi:preprotein translocase subunit SecG